MWGCSVMATRVLEYSFHLDRFNLEARTKTVANRSWCACKILAFCRHVSKYRKGNLLTAESRKQEPSNGEVVSLPANNS